MKEATLLIVGMLLSSSIMAVGVTMEERCSTESLCMTFQQPYFLDNGEYVHVEMDGAPACVYDAGKPVLPLYTTTIELPFGSTIHTVTFFSGTPHMLPLSKKITPAPYPFRREAADHDVLARDESIYTSEACYPAEWYAYSTGGGLNTQGEHVTFFTLRVFPARYNPAEDSLLYIDSCEVTITYDQPSKPLIPTTSIFDLVIITPTQFTRPLQRLAAHKNEFGVHTTIVTLTDIYRQYPGADRPEQIKYFISDAIQNWGTKYILLVGGMKSHLAGKPRDDINEGTRDWYLPVRYSNLQDIGILFDPGFISDLYYADVFTSQGLFCSWDSNGDGVFGGWSNPSRYPHLDEFTDEIDFYPDVYLGRLPCRNIVEVSQMVTKIITYEKNPADPSWFQTIVVVGGDPYDDQGTDYNEGELIGEKVLSYMPGFSPQRLYASFRDSSPLETPLTTNIVREMNEGCGFVFFDGHASPAWWNTCWPSEFEELIEDGGLSIYDFPLIHNTNRLPICIVGGCHCSQCNVTVLRTMTDPRNVRSMWSYGLPIPECWSWALTVKPRTGAIATIGSTGLGYEAGGEVGDLDGDMVNEPDCVEALGGYLQTQFFKAYGVNGMKTLGDAWGAAITKYLDIYPGMDNRSDAKTIEQWVLFGDPSLRIGGYSSS
ncbi:MAG: hypothetical protein JXA00_05305 [Candidatus Thermoplasmatota archaeon]|nr:hypothetical protein [Candidatus Thermoplasmatota archaeon]